MIVFDPLLLIVLIVVSSLVPGTLIALPFLRKTGMKLPEILMFGFILGIVLPALMLLLEMLVGINFSLPLVLFNLVALSVIGVLWGLFEKTFDFSKEAEFVKKAIGTAGKERTTLVMEAALYGVLILVVFLAFWVRVQSYGPIYQELDPYFYMYGTHQILTLGAVPVTDDTAWYPEVNASHRIAPLMMYMQAQWYALYTKGGQQYSEYMLSLTSSFYPPIAAALLAFCTFALIAQEYGRKFGIIAAALMAFLPSTILKMAAGVSEIQPYGLFALFFFFAAYAMAVKRKDVRFAALAGIAYLALLLGSSTSSIANLVVPAYIVIQGLLIFFRESGENLKQFIIVNAIVSAAVLIALFLFAAYQNALSLAFIFSAGIVMIAGATAFIALHYGVKEYVKEREMRIYGLAGLYLVIVLIIVFSPLATRLVNYGAGLVGFAVYTHPLDRTIAEQALAGSDFQGELGAIGMQLTGLPGDILSPISGLANWSLQNIGDNLVNVVFNVGAKTTAKDNSMTLVFLFGAGVAALSGLGRSIMNKFDKRIPTSDLFMLFALMIFPVAFVGLNKAKFTIFLGVMMVIAAAVVFGELCVALQLLARWFFKFFKLESMREAKSSFLTAITVVVLLCGATFAIAEFAGPPVGWSKSLVVKSLTPRYQDDPSLYTAKFADLCNYLKANNGYQAAICGAGEDPKFNDDINNQYSTLLCQLSQMDEFSSNTKLQKADFDKLLARLNSGSLSEDETIAVRLRCSKMDDYWIDSMAWLKNNVEPNARIISWWDYGHWINFFGDRNAVLRNEHASLSMIGEVAHDYVDGTPEDLIEYMKSHDSKYALFDRELLMDSGGTLGGKYGALNYLSCARDNETNVGVAPGTSQCEFDHLFETVYVPTASAQQEACTISETQNIRGIVGYVPVRQTSPDGSVGSQLTARYCMGKTKLVDGTETTAMFDLNKKEDNGDLKLHKGILQSQGSDNGVYVFSVIYNKDNIWITPQGVTNGWEDRTTKFYDSNLYRAWLLKELPGFKLVYQSDNGEVKIYEVAG